MLTSISSYTVPGTYITEGTYGSIPVGISTHSEVYMLGYSSKVGSPKVPSYITSSDDFFNVFGTSLSTPSIELYFSQRPGKGLWFVPVSTRQERTITVPNATVGEYTLTLDGYLLKYTSTAQDTVATILKGLGDLVNTLGSHLGSVRNGYLRVNSGVSTVASNNITLGSTSVPSYPTVRDIQDSLKVLTEDMPQGYLLAPEFYQAYTNLVDRVALQGILEAFVSQPEYYWVSIVDPGLSTATQTTASGAINLALQEREQFSSPRGHSWYYFPYLKNLEGILVPPSGAVVGMALRRQRNDGFKQPSAGTVYPLYGCSEVSYKIDKSIQGQLNPKGINCIRNITNKGIVVYGARTLSTNSMYTFCHVRVILNVLTGSLRTAFEDIIFSTMDGTGVLFGIVKGTAVDVCERLRTSGALFGATPSDAYLVVCDMTNNPSSQLDRGELTLDVVVKPSPMVEILPIRIFRASLGTLFAEVVNSGTPEPLATPDSTNTN